MRTEIEMLQPTHVVTDAMSTGGGTTSGQSHVQFRTIVVVSGVVWGRSAEVGSSLQFHVQFQTMVVGALCVEGTVIPLELSLVVLPPLGVTGAVTDGAAAGWFWLCTGSVWLGAGSDEVAAVAPEFPGTTGGISGETTGTTGVCD